MKKKQQKAAATKKVEGEVWTDNVDWAVKHGQLKRGKGRPGNVQALFRAVGEKLPLEAINSVRKHLKQRGVGVTGIYVAHDSMGTPRYIGRGNIFGRLRSRHKENPHELIYFSFYVVKDKVHEREVETLLIRAAGDSLYFNQRKKRVDIKPGNVRDYEAGTLFYERQQRKGKKKKKKGRSRRPTLSYAAGQ